MDSKSIFSVPIPSIPTPFMPNGDIDFSALSNMLERYISWGSTVLMLTAGDSHFACMSDREIAEVTYAVLKQVRKRAYVIVADRYFATNAAVEFARETQARGADCYMALPPDWANSTMPDELFVLLVCDGDDIKAHDCPFERILVRDADEITIHGRYIAEDVIGDDCLLHYRKYAKDNSVEGQVCLFHEHQAKTVFYRNNPYFTITSTSDDDEFLGRVALPF